MKTALCVCVKNENLYLREWVEFYKDYGFSNIILYDNNSIDGEYPQQVIGDYIDNGFVVYVGKRGEGNIQYKAYDECFKQYKDTYNWFAFFDVDEFISTDAFHNVNELMKYFGDFECVMVRWKTMTDNNLLYYDGRRVLERFGDEGFIDDWVFKPIVKNTAKIDNFALNALAKVNDIVWTDGSLVLRHYYTKTLSEFIIRKFGTCTYVNDEILFTEDNLNENIQAFKKSFQEYNEWNNAKEKVFNDFIETYKKTYSQRFKR